MNKVKQRGDKYRPVVTILKVKKGTPTVISISGNVYVLQARDQFRGKSGEAEQE